MRLKKKSFPEDLEEALGLPGRRRLDLAGMMLNVGRIGYADEGIRLTVYRGMPHNYSSELQLSRSDAEWLVNRLRQELRDPRNANLPRGEDSHERTEPSTEVKHD